MQSRPSSGLFFPLWYVAANRFNTLFDDRSLLEGMTVESNLCPDNGGVGLADA